MTRNIADLLADYTKVVHIAHHVQSDSFSRPTHSHHIPSRFQTGENIASLTRSFTERLIPTYATMLTDEDDFTCLKDTLHPVLRQHAVGVEKHGWSSNCREASAYQYFPLATFPVHILTGFNANMCILETVLDNVQNNRGQLIIPKDCVDNTNLPSKTLMDKEKALESFEKQGAIISSVDEIVTTIKNTQRLMAG